MGLSIRKDRETKEPLTHENGNFIPRFDFYSNFQKGDKMIYYCPSPKKIVIGLFQVVDGPRSDKQWAPQWSDLLLYKIQPIVPVNTESFIPFSDLVNNLDFFKDENGNSLSGKAAGSKIQSSLKEISQKGFKKIKDIYKTSTHEFIEPDSDEEDERKSNLHVDMISNTHIQAEQFQCFSFVSSQERNRVNDNLQVMEESDEYKGYTHVSDSQFEFEELPSWILDIASHIGAQKRLLYIDNIWFFSESYGFYIPFAAFEQQKDGNLRGVMDRFNSLERVLESNTRFISIRPQYFLIAKDRFQKRKYLKKIKEHGE